MNNPLRSAPDSRLQRIAGPCGIVLFGITGDLAQRKILPALYDLANRGLLPPSFAIVGVARRHIENIEEVVEASIRRGAKTAVTSTTLSQLLSGLHLVEGQFDDDATNHEIEDGVITVTPPALQKKTEKATTKKTTKKTEKAKK